MSIVSANNLACPIDGNVLAFQEKQLVCQAGHSYDISKHGYINLLPVQYKRSKQPGDSNEMVVARSRFFETGLFYPIAQQLSTLILQHTCHQPLSHILDAGCGEGYYLIDLINRIASVENSNQYSLIGLDISKYAIFSAAKKNKQITWVVGTNRQPPIDTESVDVILCVFGFPSFNSFYTLLKPGGVIILVDAGPDHLIELRKIIYPNIKTSPLAQSPLTESSKFNLIDTQQVKFECALSSNAQINNLLLMTPHFHRAKKESLDIAMHLEELHCSVDVKFTLLQKV